MASNTCERCHRSLSNPQSIENGLGPICRSKSPQGDEGMNGSSNGAVAELPFDPDTRDMVCERVPDGVGLGGMPRYRPCFNISQAIVHHSPTGLEWGYGGSGPADFALNILHLFLPPLGPIPDDCEDPERWANADVKCFRGTASNAAWRLHQPFKDEFVAKLLRKGGVIRGDVIRQWIAEQPQGDEQ